MGCNVKISTNETAALDGWGGYYDEYGVIRDEKVLKCIKPIDDKYTVVGQYEKSVDGKKPGIVNNFTDNVVRNVYYQLANNDSFFYVTSFFPIIFLSMWAVLKIKLLMTDGLS